MIFRDKIPSFHFKLIWIMKESLSLAKFAQSKSARMASTFSSFAGFRMYREGNSHDRKRLKHLVHSKKESMQENEDCLKFDNCWKLSTDGAGVGVETAWIWNRLNDDANRLIKSFSVTLFEFTITFYCLRHNLWHCFINRKVQYLSLLCLDSLLLDKSNKSLLHDDLGDSQHNRIRFVRTYKLKIQLHSALLCVFFNIFLRIIKWTLTCFLPSLLLGNQHSNTHTFCHTWLTTKEK